MFVLIVRRTFQSIIVVLVVALLAFTMFRYVDDQVAMLVVQETSLQERAACREKLGLHGTVPLPFERFVLNLVMGRFGGS